VKMRERPPPPPPPPMMMSQISRARMSSKLTRICK
jgi:hypothetical protein